jgi:hypothetical protein
VAWLIVGHLVGRLLFNPRNRAVSRGAQFLYVIIVCLLQALRLVPVLASSWPSSARWARRWSTG